MNKKARWTIAVVLLVALVLMFPATQVAYAAVIIVAPSGGTYTTIQAAVNNASPGDVIAVRTGTYSENVNLSLMGSAIGGSPGNLALVALDGPGTAVINGTGTKLTNSGSFNADLIVDGFTIANSGDGFGIKLTDIANLTVVNTTFNVIGDGTSFPTDPVADNAIDLTKTTGAGSIVIFRNTFTNITDGAIVLALSGSAAPTVTIAENTITDDASSANVTKRGITLTDSSSGSVKLTINTNQLTNFGVTGTQVIALTANTSAQLTAQVDNNTINTITTTAQGITSTTSGSAVVDLTASDNTISNLSSAGAIFANVSATGRVTARIMRNTISSVGTASSVAHGISLDALSTGGTNVYRVENNSVNGSGGSGIRIRSIGTGPLTAQATVRNNSFLNTVQGGGTNAGFYGLVGTGASDNATLTLNLTGNTVDAKNFRLENGATNAGQFRLEGNTAQTPQQNVDNNNTNGGAPAQIVGTITVVTPSITAPSENKPPVAADDTTTAFTATPKTITVLANDSDPDGGAPGLEYFTPISTRGGTVTRDDNGTPSNKTDDKLAYTSLPGFVGTDTLYYTAADASSASDPAKVTITVTTAPANTPTDTPTDTPTNTPTNTPTDTPTNTPTNMPTDTPTDIPTDTPTDTPTNAPTITPTDTPTAVPPTDTPTAVLPTSTPIPTPTPVTRSAAQDSFLRSGDSNTNEGANLNLVIRADGNNRALVTFDLAGVSGPLSQATLRLYIVYNADNWGNTGRTIDAHRLTQAWSEGNGANLQPGNLTSAQFQPYQTRGTGAGVTWRCAVDSDIHNQASDCTPTWNGGSYVATPSASVTIYKDFAGSSQLPPTTATMGWISFDVTADVNSCLANGESQCGWLIKKTEEGQPGRVEFASKEGAAARYTSQFGQLVAPQLVTVP